VRSRTHGKVYSLSEPCILTTQNHLIDHVCESALERSGQESHCTCRGGKPGSHSNAYRTRRCRKSPSPGPKHPQKGPGLRQLGSSAAVQTPLRLSVKAHFSEKAMPELLSRNRAGAKNGLDCLQTNATAGRPEGGGNDLGRTRSRVVRHEFLQPHPHQSSPDMSRG